MKCNLNKPQACFNCPYEDFLDSTYAPNKDERTWLYRIIPESREHRQDKRRKEPKEVKRRDYFHEYYINLTENQKERKRYTSKVYHREHREELNEKRREYRREYMRKYRERKAAANA